MRRQQGEEDSERAGVKEEGLLLAALARSLGDHQLGEARASSDGEWRPPKPPIIQDWVLVMAASSSMEAKERP